ncbi:MAG TPA: hypothetical protein VNF06_00055 [Candidatus Aquilonibacter sp.]|nr:hypothetical protein [Candidatus Aquilonibacter sp.]
MKKQTNRCKNVYFDLGDRLMCFCMKNSGHKGTHRYGTITYPNGRRKPEVTKYYEWSTNKNDKITQLALEDIEFYSRIIKKYDKRTIALVFNRKQQDAV